MNSFSTTAFLRPVRLLLALALLTSGVVAQGSAQSANGLQARGLPIVEAETTLRLEEVAPGETKFATVSVEAGGEPVELDSYVLKGMKKGPVFAFLFYGFADKAEFEKAMTEIYGEIPPAQTQGTILAISAPGRVTCEACEEQIRQREIYGSLGELVMADARFIADVHMTAKGAAEQTYVFQYKTASSRLNTYSGAMAGALLIRNVVSVNAGAFDGEKVEHLAAMAVASQKPAVAIETANLAQASGADAAAVKKGLRNVMHHLKMVPGAVSWMNGPRRTRPDRLPADFFDGVE
jgi:hypothetical protein